MRQLFTVATVCVVIGAGVLVAAQTRPYTVLQADTREEQRQTSLDSAGRVIAPDSTRTTLTGNVVLDVNGVVVRADRAVITGGEVALEGNVRLTMPASKSTRFSIGHTF